MEQKVKAAKRIIKKYPNRRLYDTEASCYITLDDVRQLVLDNVEISVEDSRTGVDFTRHVLLQIITEVESDKASLLSDDLLTKIIRFYGTAMQSMMGDFIDKNMALYNQMQQTLQKQAQTVLKHTPLQTHQHNQLNPHALPHVPISNVWNDFMQHQAPAIQSMMTQCLAQNTKLFVEMQQQLQTTTQTLWRSGLNDTKAK